MNAAFATYWSNQFNEPRLILPYEALGYTNQAAELLYILNAVDDKAIHDRDLIQRWGNALKMSDFFHFNLYKST